jgi:glycosyltransferase involved in cell wall biosynthesis
LNPGAGPIVGCVGGLSRHKGQLILMHAAGQLSGGPPSPTLVLVGEGPERPRLESEAVTLQGRVRVVFAGERPDARALLPAFDLLVAPSIEREGFGLAALEGMDAGLPVIASRLGGLPEAVEDGRTGLLVPPGDVRALSLAIGRLLASPAERRALGAAGKRRVESRFRAASMTRRVESVYEEVLSERRAA